jgi:anti-sigma factor RsiW
VRESTGDIKEDDLLAYADHQLSSERRADVESWLSAHPQRAEDVAVWQRQNELIGALYNPIASERIPPRLDPRTIRARGRPPAWRRPVLAAAAVLVLAIGIGGGWFGRDVLQPPRTPPTLLIDGAVTAHALYVRENRHAVEVAASDRQHLLTWLSNRIQTPIDAPDISSEGFDLVGGRLLPEVLFTNAGPAAQLMYENGAAERLTVYITAALPDHAPAYEFVKVAGVDAFYWANAKITCTVVGNLPETQMKTVAKRIYEELTRRPDTYVPGGHG